MRLRILILKIGLIVVLAIFYLALFCSCGKKYSSDFVEACYVIDTFEDSSIFTRHSKMQVTYIEPAAEIEDFISYADWNKNGIDRIYFIFTYMNEAVENIKFNNIANRQPLFDVYIDGYYHYFCLNTEDWSKGFNVNGTKINFIVKSD